MNEMRQEHFKQWFKINPNHPAWLRELQEKNWQKFWERGIPAKSEERWKYTANKWGQVRSWALDNGDGVKSEFARPEHLKDKSNLFRLDSITIEQGPRTDLTPFTFTNGYFTQAKNLNQLPTGVIACSLQEAITHHENLIKNYLQATDSQYHPFAALNLACMTDGFFLFLPKNTVLTTPLHFIFVNTQQNDFHSYPRNLIIMDENSEATLIEEHVGDAENYFTNTVTHIFAKENSKAYYHKIQSEQESATHLAHVFVKQEKNSVLKSFSLATGAKLAREDIHVSMPGEGAECQLNGFYYLNNDDQHIDNHLQIDHQAKHGTSSMLYKGILNKKSCAVFNGKVLVEKNAQQINAHQANHNLLLSQQAEINTKPELEIYADDVKCAHGATVGQLEENALFYLRSRGVDHQQAIILLLQAFSDEIMNKIDNPAIRAYVHERGHYVE